jgi:hypothetical protein
MLNQLLTASHRYRRAFSLPNWNFPLLLFGNFSFSLTML